MDWQSPAEALLIVYLLLLLLLVVINRLLRALASRQPSLVGDGISGT